MLMLEKLQAKAVLLAISLIVFLVSNLGSFFYGRSLEVRLQKGAQAEIEADRITNVAAAALAHTGVVVAAVQEDNNKEREANEKLDKANVELAKARTENRRLIAERGGLRIDAGACAGRDAPTGQTEAASTGRDDGTTAGTIALPQQVDADLQDGVDEADILLERLRVLRDWARSQGFDGPDTGQPVIPDGPDIPIR